MIQASRGAAAAMFGGGGLTSDNVLGTFFLRVYSGPVPSTPGDALDYAQHHTQLLDVFLNGNSGSAMSFQLVNGVLTKPPGVAWSGTTIFTGKDASESALEPTFYRIYAPSDNVSSEDHEKARIQGTAGGPYSGADLQFNTPLFALGSEQSIGAFSLFLG